jgi:tripartite-type tricarboxylate transporter receptor subunit TctC
MDTNEPDQSAPALELAPNNRRCRMTDVSGMDAYSRATFPHLDHRPIRFFSVQIGDIFGLPRLALGKRSQGEAAASGPMGRMIVMLRRRHFLHLAAGMAALPAISRVARAQTYPTRPVRIVVPFAPGGPNDILARLMGQWLSERLGQTFVVDNRPGAGGNIGTESVVQAPPDGYTLLQVGPSHAINATLFEKLNFNFIRDIAPIATLVSQPQIMLTHPSVPTKTTLEFIAYAKRNPGKLNMASAGTGTGPHMTGELFKMMAGVDLVHVPYRGAGPAIADLLGGQVQVAFIGPPASIDHIKAGKLRALAVTSKTRWEGLPDVKCHLLLGLFHLLVV